MDAQHTLATALAITKVVILTVWSVATAVTAALRLVPEERFVAIEKDYPRFGHFLRALRKLGSDLVPFFGELFRALGILPAKAAVR